MAAAQEGIHIALLGLGTIGQEVYRYLLEDPFVRVSHILVRDPDKERKILKKHNIEVPRELLRTDRSIILRDPNVRMVVEVTGESDADTQFIIPALEKGKDVTTANKEALSRSWGRLLATAADKGRVLRFDAAVGGGLPVVRIMQQHATHDRIAKVVGVLNGTTNFILWYLKTQAHMQLELQKKAGTGRRVPFRDALKLAQEKGLCESDADKDLNGTDTKHKLLILANLAFESEFSLSAIEPEGISGQDFEVRAADFYYMSEVLPTKGETGYDIKLLGIAERYPDGAVSLRVHPCLVREDHPIATVTVEELNGVWLVGRRLGGAVFLWVRRRTGAHVYLDCERYPRLCGPYRRHARYHRSKILSKVSDS